MMYFDMVVKMKEYKEAESLNALVQEKLQNNASHYGKAIAKTVCSKCNISLKEYESSSFVQFASLSKNAMDFIGTQIVEGAKGSLVVLCEIDVEGLRSSLDSLPKKEKSGLQFIFGKKNATLEKEAFVEQEVGVEK